MFNFVYALFNVVSDDGAPDGYSNPELTTIFAIVIFTAIFLGFALLARKIYNPNKKNNENNSKKEDKKEDE